MRNIFFILLLCFIIPNFNLFAKRKEIRISMVISGGVSLGAYEAGYNWAMIKLLRKLKDKNKDVNPKLISLAGASAGSINALLSGVYWCQKDDYKNSVNDNLFYDTWTGIDINDLIIKGKNSSNKSSLFSRAILNKKAQNIINYMQKPIFRKGCKIPLGITVTKVHPIIEDFQGIEIKIQSFAIPMTLYEKDKTLHIKNRFLNNKNLKVMDILKIPSLDNNIAEIKDILFASSAFPGAFTQVKLNYIYQGKKGSDYFLDGGLYNNIPLDLALALAPKADNFLFIDPDSMRRFNPKECLKAKNYLNCNCNCKSPRFKRISNKPNREINIGLLSTNLLPLFKSTQIFRSMKLYETINNYFRYNPNRHLILSSRYHPITGNFMWAFGAFLDKNFREYDYYVGVYDAIYRFAQEAQKRGFATYSSLVKQMEYYKNILNLNKSKDAITVYNMLLKAEFCNKLPNAKANRFAAIYKAFDLNLADSYRYSPKEFSIFLSKLDTSNIPLKKDTFLSYAKENPNRWYRQIAQSIVSRIVTLENLRANKDSDYAPFAKAVGFSAWLSMSKLTSKRGLEIQPLFIPKTNDSISNIGYKIFPHEIAIDNINGGVSLGYSIYWYRKWLLFDGIEGKLSLNIGKHIDNHLRLDIDPFVNYKKNFTIGAGVSLFGNLQNRPFWEKDSAYGLNTYIDYNDIFRFTYVRRFHNKNKNYFYFGIKNLSSLVYWLNR